MPLVPDKERDRQRKVPPLTSEQLQALKEFLRLQAEREAARHKRALLDNSGRYYQRGLDRKTDTDHSWWHIDEDELTEYFGGHTEPGPDGFDDPRPGHHDAATRARTERERERAEREAKRQSIPDKPPPPGTPPPRLPGQPQSPPGPTPDGWRPRTRTPLDDMKPPQNPRTTPWGQGAATPAAVVAAAVFAQLRLTAQQPAQQPAQQNAVGQAKRQSAAAMAKLE